MDAIGLYEYSSKDLIGHGAFAVVYKGRVRMKPHQIVAIKAITKKNLAKSQNLLGKEIKILKELTLLQHENVVALLDCKETPNHVYLVMEYCNGGDLADYLNAKGTLSEDTIRMFLRQLAGAMKALVSKDIVHRDLKPQNILLSHDGKTKNPQPHDIKLKIADFGFARFLQDGVMAATLCGSPMYMAPEVIMSLQYNSKADLWSLGTIVFQCLTGKAPFQAQTPQALKHFYEKNASLAPRIPNGTSAELTNLLYGLLKRDAKDRLDFNTFFHHSFIRPPKAQPPAEAPMAPPPPPAPVSVPVTVPSSAPVSNSSTPKNSVPSSVPGALPPSPVAAISGFSASPPPSLAPVRMRTTVTKRNSNSSSSPENADQVACDGDFVIVPAHLTMDAAENRKTMAAAAQAANKDKISGRRHTVSGANPVISGASDRNVVRPSNLPMQIGPTSEPIPVPTQKAAYQQIQQSLVRSRSRSGDSVSAMSGISSASGGSTLGPLPEDRIAAAGSTTVTGKSAPSDQSPAEIRKQARMSPLMSPRSPGSRPQNTKTRRVSAPPIPDICQLSPPNVQFTLGGTPPTTTHGFGHRRRTSSSSSCGTPPPPGQWQISPNSPQVGPASLGTRTVPTMASPIRRSNSTIPSSAGNIPALSPIQGSPNKSGMSEGQPQGAVGGGDEKALMQWENNMAAAGRAFTVPENLSGYEGINLRRRSSEMQLVSGRNVVLNYGAVPPFDRSNSWGNLSRRAQQPFGKENTAPTAALLATPPPALSEETLMSPEHNEILAKLKYISSLVDKIIEVARNKAAPLSTISETVSAVRGKDSCSGGSGGVAEFDPNSPHHRRLQQLLLYMRCLHILSQTLDLSRAELKAKKLKPSTSVKNILATLNERFRHCISMTKMLNSENLLADSGLDPHSTAFTADRIIYNYAIEQCQAAALDELFGNPEECFQRYHGAHVLLHALQFQTQNDDDKKSLAHYKDAVERRLHILEQQGFVQVYETPS